MKPNRIRWLRGERTLHLTLDDAFRTGFDDTVTLHRSPRRTVHRIELAPASRDGGSTESIVVKIHHGATGQHPHRETLKRLIRHSPARREWQALIALHRAGVRVPRPRAWGRLTSGDEFVVMDALEGQSLATYFQSTTDTQRDEILSAIARTVDQLHGAGFRHGDLHLANFWVVEKEVALLDLQRAAPIRRDRDRLGDLARLEYSMARADCNATVRRTLRQRLSVAPHFDSFLQQFLRDVVRGRARRVLRMGRNWSPVRIGGLTGMRDVNCDDAVDEESLVTLIDASRNDVSGPVRRAGRVRLTEVNVGSRVVVIKSTEAGNTRRAVANWLWGSTSRRAFLNGQRIGLLGPLGNVAAHPLAFIEECHLGMPRRSWLVLEKVGDSDLDEFRATSQNVEEQFARALGEWLGELHAFGLGHRDMKASNIRIRFHADRFHFWLIDLEDLRGPKKLSEDERLRGLIQINASLADEFFSLSSRRIALDAYLARASFSWDQDEILRRIAIDSVTRQHRWHGTGCQCLDSEKIA